MKRPARWSGHAVEKFGIRIERKRRLIVETRNYRQRDEAEYAERQLVLFVMPPGGQ